MWLTLGLRTWPSARRPRWATGHPPQRCSSQPSPLGRLRPSKPLRRPGSRWPHDRCCTNIALGHSVGVDQPRGGHRPRRTRLRPDNGLLLHVAFGGGSDNGSNHPSMYARLTDLANRPESFPSWARRSEPVLGHSRSLGLPCTSLRGHVAASVPAQTIVLGPLASTCTGAPAIKERGGNPRRKSGAALRNESFLEERTTHPVSERSSREEDGSPR